MSFATMRRSYRSTHPLIGPGLQPDRLDAIELTVTRDGITGHAECVPYKRYGESIESVERQIEQLPKELTRTALPQHLRAGAARNAVDCALWDWEAKSRKRRVWQIAGLDKPRSIVTAYTLTTGSPDQMKAAAKRHTNRPILKLLLNGANDIDCVEAVREATPTARLFIDLNGHWDAQTYVKLAPQMARLGVELIEQPLPPLQDEVLAELPRPLPVCADEHCHDSASLQRLVGRYDIVSIKIDKAGGLTEALAMRRRAVELGFQVMVGNIGGSSLGMAPAILVAQGVDYVDLDGPLLLAQDRAEALRYEGNTIYPPRAELWG